MVKEDLCDLDHFLPRVHACAPFPLYDEDEFFQVAYGNNREKCDAPGGAFEVFTRRSCNMDRHRNILPLPAVEKPILLRLDRHFIRR